MEKVFIPTTNYQKLKELYNDLLADSFGIDMAAVIGPYGRGKSMAAERVVTHNKHSVYICFEPRMTLVSLIRETAFALGGVRPRSSDACIEIIREEINSQRRIIIVDEADQMNSRQLNQLRSFHDLLSTPILLVGENTLYDKLNREGRLMRRVRSVLRFAPVSQADVAVFYKHERTLNKSLTPEQSAVLLADSKGDFGRVFLRAVRIEGIMKKSGINEITDEIIEKACG